MMEQVAKIIEVSSSSEKGFVDAIEKGLKKCSKTVKNIQGAYIKETTVTTDEQGNIREWRVNLKVTFLVK